MSYFAHRHAEVIKDRLDDRCSVKELLQDAVFVVPDTGPDTVLGIFLMLAYLDGVIDGEVFSPWIEAVLDWEKGIIPDDWQKTWTSVSSAIAHLHYDDFGKEANPEDSMHAAFKDALLFLLIQFECKNNPADITFGYTEVERRVSASVNRLKQIYRQTFPHSQIVQLTVPLLGANTRTISVDTLIVVEHEQNDAVKLLSRVDSERAPSGVGFGLVLSFRPNADPWNFVTLYSDPTQNLDLSAIWVALEAAETEKYRAENGTIDRPAGKNSGFLGDPKSLYPPSELTNLDKTVTARLIHNAGNCWINPWFLAPDRSLIASPGKNENREPMEGTRLTIKEIVNTLWTICLPLGDTPVITCEPHLENATRQPIDRSASVFELSGTVFSKDDENAVQPVFRYVRWPRNSDRINHISDTSNDWRLQHPGGGSISSQTAERVLATLAGKASAGIPAFDELLLADGYNRLELGGGFALISDTGVIVIDDWGERDLCASEIWNAFQSVADIKSRLQRNTRDVAKQSKELANLVHDGPMSRRLSRATESLAVIRSRVTTLSVSEQREQLTDSAAIHLHKVICDRWQLGARIEALNLQISRIDDSISALGEKRSAGALRLLSLFGLPLYGAGQLNGFTVDTLMHFGFIQMKHQSIANAGFFLVWMAILSIGAFYLVKKMSSSKSDPASQD